MKLPRLVRISDPDEYPGTFLVFEVVEKWCASGFLIESNNFMDGINVPARELPTYESALAYARKDRADGVYAFDQKWDGCQNVDFTRCWVHTCHDDHADNLAKNLKAIRKHGLPLIVEAGGHILQ